MRSSHVALAVTALACAPAARPAPTSHAGADLTKSVSFSLLEDYDKGTDLREVDADFALMRELGIETWRGSFGWDDYEPESGEYDFTWLREFAALAAERGIALRPYIGYTPAWAGTGRTADGYAWNDPPANLDRWERFVDTLARALADRPSVVSYEIYNEENVPLWWDGSAEEYAAVLGRAVRALSRAAPRAEVLLGGMVYPDAEWLETVCGSSENAVGIDVVPFHAYPETWTPESVTVERYLDRSYRESFLPAVRESCGPKPVWINETGYATTPGRSERDQASWWARAIATFAADSAVAHIGVYEVKDLDSSSPVIGDAPNYHLGLTRVDRTKKLAFHTVRVLASFLDGEPITVADRRLSLSVTAGVAGELHRHLFVRRDGRQLLVVWDTRGAPTLTIGGLAGTRATEYAFDGTAHAIADFADDTFAGVALARGEPRIFVIEP